MQTRELPVPSNGLIAIVEDDESLRCALVTLFRSLGWEARGFGSAEDFLAVPDRWACVITDIQLPGENGLDLARRLREQDHDAPVIVITARTEEGLAAQAEAIGAVCLLRKPFDTGELIDCVERALGA